MSDKVFIDTNIFLYAKFDDKSEKFKIANQVLGKYSGHRTSFISTQVINEFVVNCVRKNGDPLDSRVTAKNISDQFTVLPLTMNTVNKSFELYQKYRYSHWDCLILAAALEAGSEFIFTEDMTNGQIIENLLTIVNPFSV